jgi:hypothetical protein
MQPPIEIEDIDARRRQEGIDDVDLQQAIGRLSAGDRVILTLVSDGEATIGESLVVRITRVCKSTLRGKVVETSPRNGRSRVRPGTALTFTRANIHSVQHSPNAAAGRLTRGESGLSAAGPSSVVTSLGEARARLGQDRPLTTEECLNLIAGLATRIVKHVEYISRVGTMSGTSAETREKAVASFYERMVVLERQLGRIQDELMLG